MAHHCHTTNNITAAYSLQEEKRGKVYKVYLRTHWGGEFCGVWAQMTLSYCAVAIPRVCVWLTCRRKTSLRR
jgi:hypothetical protein